MDVSVPTALCESHFPYGGQESLLKGSWRWRWGRGRMEGHKPHEGCLRTVNCTTQSYNLKSSAETRVLPASVDSQAHEAYKPVRFSSTKRYSS